VGLLLVEKVVNIRVACVNDNIVVGSHGYVAAMV
jgi:hypothetical protein